MVPPPIVPAGGEVGPAGPAPGGSELHVLCRSPCGLCPRQFTFGYPSACYSFPAHFVGFVEFCRRGRPRVLSSLGVWKQAQRGVPSPRPPKLLSDRLAVAGGGGEGGGWQGSLMAKGTGGSRDELWFCPEPAAALWASVLIKMIVGDFEAQHRFEVTHSSSACL